MSLTLWLRNLTSPGRLRKAVGSRGRATPSLRAPRPRPQIEALEDRLVPSGLVIDDSGSSADTTYTITAATVQINNQPPIFYSGYDSLTLKGSSGTDTCNVQGLASAIPVTLAVGAGTTAVNVGAAGDALDPLQGALRIAGNYGTAVTFNNQGADPSVSHADVWSAGHVDFGNLQVDFSDVARMTLNEPGWGAANEHVFATTPAVGGLTLNGAGHDILSATAGANDWCLSGFRSGRLNGVIAFNNVAHLVAGGTGAVSGADVFRFLPGGFMDQVSLGRDRALLDFAPFTPGITVNLPDASGSGSVPGVIRAFDFNPAVPATLSIRGTCGNDTFTVRGPNAAAPIALDGGGGTDTLDYSAYVGDVVVDLALGTATGVGGGVAGIANVTGSVGNDLLVGDANANVLRGGTGRNLLIGGGGPDQLYGGGDNLQIGGTTAYDQDLTALLALLQEFTRPDLDFYQRVNDLRTGTGLNGPYVLNADPTVGPVTVFDDGAADVLTAGGALDWFFVNAPTDVLVNPQPGDIVTLV